MKREENINTLSLPSLKVTGSTSSKGGGVTFTEMANSSRNHGKKS